MASEPIKSWLTKRRRREIAGSAALGLLSFAAGLILLFLTFWFVYAGLWIIVSGASSVTVAFAGKALSLSHGWKLALSSSFIVLLFIGNARSSREYLGTYPRDDYPVSPAIYGGGLSLLWLLKHSEASSKMICDLLFTGPRLVLGGWEKARRILRLKNLDVESCSSVLGSLVTSDSSVSREQFNAELSHPEWVRISNDLRLFDGVLALAQEPLRLSLAEDLRCELRNAAGIKEQSYAPVRSHY